MANRELKFRAWDGRRFIYFSDITIGLKGSKKTVPYIFFAKDNFNGEVYLGEHEVTEFTGLKDENRKEVYEGDIVDNDVARWEVIFNLGCFCGRQIGVKPSSSGVHIALRGIRNIRIVGNKFENPELVIF